ncbi:ABC transporter ATP-binding protein [Clostridium tagluense]|uniref:ABC transporter ATP-binding protein n=1 Tax=Clostridium TaxID=1485 RepID=UPI0013E94BAD|nr:MULTISPECIES: ABC transporter ATP-binding protein [Clostridium]MBU3127561.1 ABC transporter ATP-binding protein [Clostridium tagluense]MBW9157981.1 ABC transporter ATP-binding protein [Clostridium tagluense]MBZ9621905.1 ABC transporter ATP-binding protein [Clostridium sp. FP2]MCB2312572.1 ABC transporter ATP-binding protein [Clostridium tagluense]MCB2317247.1 ABC transporter ATP-binding protein [Clostridium tagluense]
MNKLEIKNLTKSFGKKNANNNITLTLENGVYGLLGPNGAGKTTLMKQIVTLTKPTSGEIIYNGKSIYEKEDEYRNIIGYLPQEFGAYKNFTAKQFLKYVAALKGIDKNSASKKIDELLNLVGLYEVRNKAVGKFSGGMKRRVGIAQVLLNDPQIVVLDEPTAGLDPQERARFRNLIAEISKDKIIILSTHIISDIEAVARETIMIKNGSVIIKGNHKDILDGMNGKVYKITTNKENEVMDIQRDYKVVNLQRGADITELRVVSDKMPLYASAQSIEPRFEDVYMFYFDLENTREV